MKTIFDKSTRDELIARIEMLDENSKAQWGRMNIYQMLKHCTLWEEMVRNKTIYKRALLGRLFGRMALKNMLKEGKRLPRNSPTVPELRIRSNGNVAAEKAKWIDLIEQYEHYTNPGFVHPFFGKMTTGQIGYQAYMHADHHLRQFNC